MPDHYEWFTSYLRARRMDVVTRGVMVVVASSLGLIPLAQLLSSTPPAGPTATTLAVFAGIGGVGGAVLWLVTFPTRAQSVAFAMISSGSIAAAAFAQREPTVMLLACSAFVTISGYIALFHTPLMMVLNLVLVATVPILAAVRFAATAGAVQGVCVYAVLLVANVAVPFGIQIIVNTLGVDLLNADRDPLTGLLNRRAFHQGVLPLAAAEPQDAQLVVAMIDLDRFKNLNDTHGHSAGDHALVAVAHALRGHTRERALVSRVGGEEFLVADVFTELPPESLGQRLCAAVAALPHGLTASVGTTAVDCDRVRAEADPHALITALIGAADTAMYVAKRSGGNQTRHRLDPLDESLQSPFPAG